MQALWAIRELQSSGVTVLRLFGAGVTTDFTYVKKYGTAGADGTTWPNGTYMPKNSSCSSGSCFVNSVCSKVPPSN